MTGAERGTFNGEVEMYGDYADDGLMKIEYVFWVKSITTMNDKEIDAKIKENYLEKYPDRNKGKD